ncbi:MAG: S8 family serine peptidase, partial [Actinobacteria bacterium]|nr:S8 family serine peptidase [Actinomycetota bacterium]
MGPRPRGLIVVALVVLMGVLGVPSAGSATVPSAARASAPDEVLVRFRHGASQGSALRAIHAMSSTALRQGWTRVKIASDESVDAAIARLSSDPSVESVQPNYVYKVSELPNDTLFGKQWGLDNTGQTLCIGGTCYPGTAGADISASGAWDHTTGSPSVVVAIVDTGVAYDHPDLAAHLWTNPSPHASPPQQNDLHGWDFVDNDNTPYDENGHGTHVAGIIGARGNDAYGTTGVARSVTIMPVRALDANGSGFTSDIANAFGYAADHGAKVVNASLGGPDNDTMLEDAITSAPNTLFVLAAGNDHNNNDTTPTYPCNVPSGNVLCVAATDQNDGLASFSNYGRTAVDLGAPGVNIASTWIPEDPATDGSYSLSDSPNGAYADDADTWAQIAQPLDLHTLSSCALTYHVRESLGAGDSFSVERSTDNGATWSILGGLLPNTNGAFAVETVALPSVSSLLFRYHLHTDGSAVSDGVYVDGVDVACNGVPFFSDGFETDLSKWTHG